MKQFAEEMLNADKEIGREKCVKYVQTEQKDIGKLVQISGKNVKQMKLEFPPNQCQFCLFEVKYNNIEDVPNLMWKHLLLNCPCCTCCPSCHQMVENIFMPTHLANECRESFKYKLMTCPKCNLAFEEQELEDHYQHCTFELQSTESVCPFCGLLLDSEKEEQLTHFSEG